MNKHLWGFSFLISLPAVALCIAGCWFMISEVPRFVAAEKNAASRAYRQVAEALWRDLDSAEFTIPREKGWWQTGRVGKKERRRKPLPWGHLRQGERELIWVGEEVVHGCRVEPIELFDFELFFAWTMPIILSLFILLTALCIRFFVRYAKERDDFMAATAHDLKTPLAAMRRLIGRDDAEAKNLAEQLVRLVQNLTDFLALHGKPPPLRPSQFDLRATYRAAYRLFEEDFRFYFDGRDITVEGPDAIPVVSDETRVAQVLWNLLANELKYAAPFGTVSVQFKVEDEVVSVKFIDTGKGLSAQERKRIFRRYYRAKSLMSSGKGGFGIGLATARDFARRLGGNLTVMANQPKGCVFTFVLRRHLV